MRPFRTAAVGGLGLALVVGMFGSGPATASAAAPARPDRPAFSTAAARGVVDRMIPGWSSKIELGTLAPAPSGKEQYRIGRDKGEVLISGSSPSALLNGVGQYLKYTAHRDISWSSDASAEPLAVKGRPPLPASTVTRTANVSHRVLSNDTADGYTNAYWDWDRWQREIDVAALHGINEFFMPVGMEAVYQQTMRQFGYSEAEMRAWIPMPAHQPWWLLQNMSNFTSDQESQALIDSRAALGRKIADRMRTMGMEPVFPGYFGTVPSGFVAKNPGAAVVPQGDWSGTRRPDWLDPRTAVFGKVAAAFYRSQKQLFGDTGAFKMDLLHEGGKAGTVPVGDAAKAVQSALDLAHPDATWVILGWQSNPGAALLSGVDRSRMLIVDGLTDRYADSDATADPNKLFGGTPYAFGAIWNFGGHTTLGANTGVWNKRFFAQLDRPGTALDGIAVLPEANDNNDAAFEFLTELAWQPAAPDQAQWFSRFADARYGADPHAEAAWKIISGTAYSLPADGWSEAQDGLFGAAPSLTTTNAAAWSPDAMRYDPVAFERALDELLQVSPALRGNALYQYDVVDVARQVLSNRSRSWLPQIMAAYDAKDRPLLKKLSQQWLGSMSTLDALLGSRPEFQLGGWLKYGSDAATTPADKAAVQRDMRSLITNWGGRSGVDAGLGDYANREWSGLVGDYYLGRWQQYFRSLDTALAQGTAPAAIDWYTVGEDWIAKRTPLPATPSGDPVRLATALRDQLRKDGLADRVTLKTAGPYLDPAKPLTVTATVRNGNGLTSTDRVSAVLTPPAGVRLTTPATVTTGRIAPGKSATLSWTVRADSAPTTPTVRLRAAVSVTHAGSTTAAVAGVDTPVAAAPKAGTDYLSDLPFIDAQGGYGPWERDTSNGEEAPGDGHTLTMLGTTYAKGLGTNSDATVTFYLGGQCSSFSMTAGIDDDMRGADKDPRVTVSVLGDGTSLGRSGELNRTAPLWQPTVDITGVQLLTLRVDKVKDVNWYDHTDLADAKVVCA
ncbi:alpha-N-acetylglucosaminidase TIM-barrel domain-containing protein [Streptomyces sp. NBC_01766]|uniref:alpha-N-acetylglucosaminidase TIM-barrel domain-containing protein n=1 Tax=Streptomyces sp. NBC_01766 TaxID=2975936 RepID=UPI002DDA5317|nr:alpha-N-acetylglucosaminidase TIM-barrel domain-containing protein [Streptomyces sp. NBC_01766]WSC22463.1 alpha-N-acetylglucosaminidase C-terminal domain-containing protein [Streptomyces sp. NBC_01766]